MTKLVRALSSFPYYNIKKGQVRKVKFSSSTFYVVRHNKRANAWTLLPAVHFTELNEQEKANDTTR